MAFQVTASLLQAPLGIMADKRNLGILMPLSVLVGGVLACALGLTDSILVLIAIIILSGICASGFHPIAGGIVPLITPKGKNVLATSIFIVGGNVGFAIAPFITAIYLEHFEVNELIYLAIIPIVTTIFIFKQRLHIKAPTKVNNQDLKLKVIIKNKDFCYLVLSIGLRAVCYCSLIVYIPLLFTQQGISSISASSVLTTLLIGTAIGGLAVGSISKYFKLRTIIVYSYILTFVMMAIFLFKVDDSFVSYLSIFIAGIGLYASTPPAIVWAQKLLPNANSFATSIMLGFTFGIGYILSVLIGLLGDFVGLQLALTCFIMPCLILAIISILKVR